MCDDLDDGSINVGGILCNDGAYGYYNKYQGSAYLYRFVIDWGYEFVDKLLASDGYAYDRF